MGLYVDSAVLEDVSRACATYPVAGVTTNPSIILAAMESGQRMGYLDVLRRLLEIVEGPIFAQPVGESPGDLIRAGQEFATLDNARIVLKLPMSAVGVEAALTLRGEGARISFTAVTSLAQAYSGLLAGAEWIIPYFGRLRRAGIDACQRLLDMSHLIAGEGSGTRLLAASVKSSADVVEAVLAGANDVTVPPRVIRDMMSDPLSDDAIRQFTSDWAKARDIAG